MANNNRDFRWVMVWWSWSGWWGFSCAVNGTVTQVPIWQSFNDPCDFIQAFFGSTPPSVGISVSPTASLREVWDDVVDPTITGAGNLGSNPAWTLTLLEFFSGNTGGTLIWSQASPVPWTPYPIVDTFTVSSNQQYTVRVTDSEARVATASATYSFTLPWFYGTVNGWPKPTPWQSLIDNGIKLVQNSNGNINANFNSASTDWIWFAIPQWSTTKTSWFVDALNQWAIGWPSDLFWAEQIVSVDSPDTLWSSENYKFYISNFTTEVTQTMQLRN